MITRPACVLPSLTALVVRVRPNSRRQGWDDVKKKPLDRTGPNGLHLRVHPLGEVPHWRGAPHGLTLFIGKAVGNYRVVKLKVRESESIQEAVRRFRKLVERSGIKKEMRRKEYYEKPSDTRRRARLRAERRARRTRLGIGPSKP